MTLRGMTNKYIGRLLVIVSEGEHALGHFQAPTVLFQPCVPSSEFRDNYSLLKVSATSGIGQI